MRPLYLVVPAASLLSCQNDQATDLLVRTDSAGVEIVQNDGSRWQAAPWSIASEPRISIGVLEGPDAQQFSRIAAAIPLPDGRIGIANFANPPDIRVFDSEGNHIVTFGRTGEGPGEFQAISWLNYVPPDTVRAFDFWQSRITYFDLHGDVLAVVPITEVAGATPTRFVLTPGFDDGELLAKLNQLIPEDAEGRGRSETPLIRVRHDGSLVDTLATTQDAEYYVSSTGDGTIVPFSPRTAVLPLGNMLAVSSGESFRIDIYDLAGNLVRSIRRSGRRRPVTAADFAAFRAEQIERARSPSERARIEQRLSDVPRPATMPAYDQALQADSNGNLWVKQYRAPSDSIDVWDVYEPSGGYLGQVDLPLNFAPTHIGTNVILGIWRDNSGVESVRIYDLRKNINDAAG